MKILNQVTFTIFDIKSKTNIEQSTKLIRDKKLTMTGAQTILRKEFPRLNVVRLESFVLEQ